ncbi:hypothetical protein WJX73_008009 [Symbiochloris irregularis]|uniref:SS18 N-terminal domain-containing protein n=1 Tax=Symbiochloris irregularis TaxID=706552 RepID=A0AAW1PAS6_9CHLO
MAQPPAVRPGAGHQLQQIPSSEVIQQYLEDNDKLIQAILENLNAGRLQDGALYQTRLQQNLMWLAAIADAQPHPAPAPATPAQQPAVQAQSVPQRASAAQAVHVPSGSQQYATSQPSHH